MMRSMRGFDTDRQIATPQQPWDFTELTYLQYPVVQDWVHTP